MGRRAGRIHAPYDGIIVAAGGPKIPESLKEQLKIGGRLVIPVGRDQKVQELVRITRISEREFRSEDLADVRFVPLIGHEGWEGPEVGPKHGRPRHRAKGAPEESPAQLIADACEPISSIDSAQLGPCSPELATPGLCYWARPLTALPNSIACATASRAN